jgi:glycosyltransferase involved in cell wall biosynthesis
VLRDLLGDGTCGALAKLDDAGDLAAKVLALWADAGARRGMGAAARERVLERHSREKVAQALVDFYARVAARASR